MPSLHPCVLPDEVPGLPNRAGPVKVRAPRTVTFNCVAWAAGFRTWTWQDEWDEGGPEARESMRRFFRDCGFRDLRPGEAFDPAKVYVLLVAHEGTPTHAMKWDPKTGLWTSKNGGMELVEAPSWSAILEEANESAERAGWRPYGDPFHVMVEDPEA